MQEKDAKKLFEKVKSGTITSSERALLDEWYHQYNEIGQPALTDQDYQTAEEKIWTKLKSKLPETPVKKIIRWRPLAIAASVALFLTIGTLLLIRIKTNEDPSTQNISHQTPANENKLLQLPDGSTVILYKGSRLDCARSFTGKKTREVFLTGKAFFDVKHRVSQPFIVHSGKVNTTVLGTAFDITANPGTQEITVRVIRGKVNVSVANKTIGTLLPDKKVTYNTQTNVSGIADVNAAHEMSWTHQDMLLNNITFEGICAQLEERYNVKIKIANESLRAKKFTISLRSNENLGKFLQTVCDFNGATFKQNIENNEITITAIN